MKVLNYVLCSTIILVGIVLVSSGEIIQSIAGLVWFVVNMKFACLKVGKKMWKRYWKTNMELNRYFGLE